MLYKKNKVNLYIDTNLIDTNDQAIIYHNSNKFRFKTYVNGIIEIQNLQDFIIRLSIVTSLFFLSCPHFLMDYYFLNALANDPTNALANDPTNALANDPTNALANDPTNALANIYLKISIYENIILSVVAYYFIMSEDLDDIYETSHERIATSNLIIISKIENFWAKYYSVLGLVIATNFYFTSYFYFTNSYYLNPTYMYILCFSIFRLLVLRYFKNKKLI
jgi:hypothetical protein